MDRERLRAAFDRAKAARESIERERPPAAEPEKTSDLWEHFLQAQSAKDPIERARPTPQPDQSHLRRDFDQARNSATSPAPERAQAQQNMSEQTMVQKDAPRPQLRPKGPIANEVDRASFDARWAEEQRKEQAKINEAKNKAAAIEARRKDGPGDGKAQERLPE